MGFAHSPKIATDGLVFYYDTANTVKSYKGEPTTNQYTNPTFSNGTTGWVFGSWNGNTAYTTETVIGPFGESVTALKLTQNTSPSTAHFHQGNNGKYVTGVTYTLSAWVKGFGTLRGNTQWGGVDTAFTLTGDWQYIEYTVTAPNSTQYPYWAADILTQGTDMYMTYAQSEAKSHATPFVDGTRSATEGLLDLIKTSTIDLTNVSFDTNAQMTFDGTNDQISIPSNTVFDTNSFTVEAVCKLDAFDNQHRTVVAHNASVYTHNNGWWVGTLRNGLGTGGNDFRMFVWGDSSYVVYNDSIGGNDGQYHHLVLTCDEVTVTFYIDGTQVHSTAKPAGNAYTTGQDVLVGNSPAGDYWSGEIPLSKVYNRALTAEEVAQNYNAIKGRYGI